MHSCAGFISITWNIFYAWYNQISQSMPWVKNTNLFTDISLIDNIYSISDLCCTTQMKSNKWINLQYVCHGSEVSFLPCKHSTRGPPEASHPMEASYLSPTGWHRSGLRNGPPEASHLWAYSFSPWPSSVPPVYLFQWIWPPLTKLMPPHSLLLWHRFGLQPSATGWLVEAGLLCAEPPHCYQTPTGGTLAVIKQPPWPPRCLLLPPAGQRCSVQKCS